MPLIDVTQVLDNPLFYTFFNVYRYDQLIDNNGLTQVVNPRPYMGVSGVVTAVGSRELNRLPEEERLEGLITIYTKFRLTGGKGATSADEIEWPKDSGNFYVVIQVDNWSEYGAGFIQALATLGQLRPPAK